MGGLLLDGDAQTGRRAAKALRSEAGGVDGVQQFFFQRGVIRVLSLIHISPNSAQRNRSVPASGDAMLTSTGSTSVMSHAATE